MDCNAWVDINNSQTSLPVQAVVSEANTNVRNDD